VAQTPERHMPKVAWLMVVSAGEGRGALKHVRERAEEQRKWYAEQKKREAGCRCSVGA
jgi:hypothetical protein